MNDKTLKKSPLTIALYGITVLLLIYAIYMMFSTVSYLNNYFSTYGSTFGKNIGSAMGYIMTQSLAYFVYAILTFASARIYDEVRKLNPKNYLSAAEVQTRKNTKKAAHSASSESSESASHTDDAVAAAKAKNEEEERASQEAQEAAEETLKSIQEDSVDTASDDPADDAAEIISPDDTASNDAAAQEVSDR